MSLDGPVLRVATETDVDAISDVMRASVLELFPQFYDERQTVSAATHVAHVTRFWSPTVRTAFTMSAVRSC